MKTKTVIESKAFSSIPDGATVVEVGSYVGDWLARLNNNRRGCRLFAIEPSPENYEKLVDNVGSIATCINGLVCGDTDGAMIYAHKQGKSHCMYRDVAKYKGGKIKKVAVPAYTMGEVIKENRIDHIDLVRFDCYGGEYSIFSENTSFLNIVDVIQITFYVKPVPFNTLKFKKLRSIICETLSSQFDLIEGGQIHEDRKHIRQLWKRRDSGF